MAIDFGGCKSGAHRPAALVCGLFLPRLTRSSPSLSPPTSWKRCRRRLHGRRIVAAAVRRKRGASRSAKETTLRKKRERREKFGAKFWRRFWPAVFCDVFLRRCSSGGSHPRVLLSAVRLCAVCACRCGDGPRLGGRPGGAMAFAPFFLTLSLSLSLLRLAFLADAAARCDHAGVHQPDQAGEEAERVLCRQRAGGRQGEARSRPKRAEGDR